MKKLPVGLEDFKKLIKNDFYYVDKTLIIRELLSEWGDVNLFTRPRRFGKTLTLDMVKCFFEIGQDKSLFDGLAISKEKELDQDLLDKLIVILNIFTSKGKL